MEDLQPPGDSAAPWHRPLKSALVTGACGFVGSTLVARLLAAGTRVVGLDNLERGHADALPTHVPLVRGDVCDPDAVQEALGLCGGQPEAVFHLAALILVGESVSQPERYLRVNAGGTQVVADACLQAGVPALILASSAAVLAADQQGAQALDESALIGPESPYGLGKWRAEQTLLAAAQTGRISTVALRFFNVAGSEHGCDERHDPESHLIPLAVQAALGLTPPLKVFGTDFDTPDGTCLRDYVHIRDVVQALVRGAGLARGAFGMGEPSHEVFHVGSGRGASVLQVIGAVEDVLGVPVPHALAERRPGDVPSLVSEPSRMRKVLGIRPSQDLHEMVRDCARVLKRG